MVCRLPHSCELMYSWFNVFISDIIGIRYSLSSLLSANVLSLERRNSDDYWLFFFSVESDVRTRNYFTGTVPERILNGLHPFSVTSYKKKHKFVR